jgi:hypothetical protein
VEARALDRDRDTLGDELEQLDVVPRELPLRERTDVEYAERRARYDERHAEHRLDALLPQDRVPDRELVDVDHARPPLGRDPAGEALAERDADALLDLLLDPERRARDELVLPLVE